MPPAPPSHSSSAGRQPRPIASSRRILANTAYRAVADIGSKLVSVALYVVMARELGEDGFGVFTFALAFVTLVTALAGFGQDPVLTREVARRPELVHRYFANTLSLKLVLSVPSLALAVVGASLAGTDPETIDAIALLGIAIIIEALISTCFATYQAFERISLLPVVLIGQRVLMAVIAIPALLAGADVVTVSAIYLGSAVTMLVVALVLLVRRVVAPRVQITPSTWLPLMRMALPVGISGVFATVLFRVDTVMLQAFETSRVVGAYGAAYRLFETVLFLSWAVLTATYPVLARLSRSTTPSLAAVSERAMKLAFAPTLPFAVGSAVLAGPVIRLVYGPEFSDGASALALLAPALALYPLYHVAAGVLLAQDRQAALAVIHGGVAVENIAANFVLIPRFSLDGAALGTSISQAILAIATLHIANRLAGGLNWRRMLAGPVLAAIAAGGGMLALRDEPLLIAAGAGALTYAAVLLTFERLVYPDDARTIARFLGRRADA
jgi:O-antigen/teichoic acid export membrane protein